MSAVDVSILMCTHNRAAMLREAIASLVAQETAVKFTFELVVVHSGAAETIDVIEEVRKTSAVPVRAAYQQHRGISVARNRALDEARGEWFAWFDDDQLADPMWLKALLDIAIEKNCQSTGGIRLLKLPENCHRHLTKACRRSLGESEIWSEARPYNPKEGPPGGSHLLHRSIFEKVGKYDEAFGLRGEDTDLYRRICQLGIVSWYTPLSICHHMIPPDRLTREYFQTTALHDGWAFAQRDRRKKGAAMMAGAAIARIGQAACINMPRLAKARLAGDQESILDAEIRLWIAEGFTRSSLYSLAPNFFRQTQFFSRYEFRPERRFLPQA